MSYVAVCTYCFGRDTLDCPRCRGSRYELMDDRNGSPAAFIRPATKEEYLRQVREATREQRHAYRTNQGRKLVPPRPSPGKRGF